MSKYSEEHKNAALRLITYARLGSIGRKGESFDAIITRLLDDAKVPVPKM